MASLYEIDAEILACVDSDTGEIIDCEKLMELQLDRTHKIEAIALWVKNLTSDAAAFEAEKEAFAEREKNAKSKADQLKKLLAHALNGEKFQTDKCAVSFRKSQSVNIVDESIIPSDYLVEKIDVFPDKTAIKNDIKSGTNVPGCSLIDGLSTQIK